MVEQIIPNAPAILWGVIIYLIVLTIMLWWWFNRYNDKGE